MQLLAAGNTRFNFPKKTEGKQEGANSKPVNPATTMVGPKEP
jgi:hypothetical protein